MTLLASWVAVDSRNPSSIYIMSDSRIRWNATTKFDHGKKIFACKNSPDIFGYCGDVLFPSIVLNQIVDMADQGLLFEENWSCEQKSNAVATQLYLAFRNYPKDVESIFAKTLHIIHCSRDKDVNFYCRKINWTAEKIWKVETHDFESYSDKLFVVGSGANEFLEKFEKYKNGDNQKTSRSLFHCFTDTLSDIKDIHCGGAPQLAGLYRIQNGRYYGIINNNKRYFQGVESDELLNFDKIEWRNELFEICDGYTMKIKDKAQRQPNPLKP